MPRALSCDESFAQSLASRAPGWSSMPRELSWPAMAANDKVLAIVISYSQVSGISGTSN